MQEQTVSSYVRNRKVKVQAPDQSMPALVLIAITLAALAIYIWPVVLTIAAVTLVRYALKFYAESKVEPEPEVVAEAPKQKRGYHKRIRVNHYQVKKQVVL